MHFIQGTAMVVCLTLASMTRPSFSAPLSSDISQRTESVTRSSDSGLLFQPKMYLIFPGSPSQFLPPVSQLEVLRTSDISVLENIAIFEGIPANAKTCVLGWAQAEQSKRTEFVVARNGLLATQQLEHLPDGDLTWENIAPIAQEAVQQGRPLLHPETTGWTTINTAESHIAGYVDCAETIYLKIQADDRSTDGFVYLGQDGINGLTLEVH